MPRLLIKCPYCWYLIHLAHAVELIQKPDGGGMYLVNLAAIRLHTCTRANR